MAEINPNEMFVYDENSPSKLSWKIDRWGGTNYHSKIRSAGDHAGTLNIINKMWHIQFRGSPKPAHRIIWEMFYNEVDVVVSHINGDTTDNTLSNLTARKAIKSSLAADAAERGAWGEIFYLDVSSCSGIKWKIDNYTGYLGNVLKAREGDDVYQFKDGDGYWCISVGRHSRHSVKVHKVIYELNYGTIQDGLLVDHIDGNIGNNEIANLRIVTLHGNARNRKLTSRNTTGVNGVNFRDQKGKRSYRATWSCHTTGECLEKSFSVSKYGEEGAFRLACEYRAKMIEELNAQGAGYTERHGT